jgi:hypothetical protein
MRVTEKDLRREVDLLNKKFKKTNKTAVKFAISSAYGGHQVVLRNNKSGGVREVTYGHKSPRETLEALEKKPMQFLRYDVNRFHRDVMSYKKK